MSKGKAASCGFYQVTAALEQIKLEADRDNPLQLGGDQDVYLNLTRF